MKIVLALLLTMLVLAEPGFCAREIMGAGATFPYPLYSKMFSHYHEQNGVRINYQAIGSGGGIKQLLARTVEFGGTDAFMKEKELSQAHGEIVHIPTCLGAVVVTYNVKGAPKLNLSPDVVADIFLGKINKWNDERISKTNPGIELPDTNIIVVHRSDGSGTTAIFSDWLSKASPEWKSSVGSGKTLNWPVGLGQKGNQGVSGLVKNIPGSIGYCEYIYAANNNMTFARIRNKAGNFVEPSLETVSLAANVQLPDDTRVSITNTDSKDGYPVSGFTWLILYREQNYSGRNQEKAKELLSLVWWVTHEGQALARPLHYAPLPTHAVEKAENIIKSVVYDGKPVLE